MLAVILKAKEICNFLKSCLILFLLSVLSPFQTEMGLVDFLVKYYYCSSPKAVAGVRTEVTCECIVLPHL